MTFPPKVYFHIGKEKRGLVFQETDLATAGSIESAAESVDDFTHSFWLLEDGVLTDVSEDVALEWTKTGDIRFTEDGDPLVPDFIRNHASEALDQLFGQIAVERINNRQLYSDYQARAL